jgi:hypothetical protein
MKSLYLVLLLALLAGSTQAQAPADGGGEKVDVEIKIIPFYAVDAEGKPVFDLKQDEVELRLDGKPLALDTFDAFAKDNEGEEAAAARGRAPRRHVVLFLDTAFSSPRGFTTGQEFAAKMVNDLPAGDLLYLVTHEYQSGLKQRLGPLAATPAGKSKMLAELRSLNPEIGQINPETGFSMSVTTRGVTKNGVPSAQNMVLDEPLRTTQQAQLESVARTLAESLQALADQFQRIREPKLLVFLSQGIDPLLYWVGSDLKLGGQAEIPDLIVKGSRYTGLYTLYEKPLQQLADTGAMSLFVNLDDQAKGQRVNDGSLQHMARASGGLYLGGVDASLVNDRAARSTAAYYEAGFYLTSSDPKLSRGKVEVVVNRPGVSTWSAGTIKTRETWRGLTDDARRLLIVDLVEGEQRARKPVKLTLENLPGNVQGGRTAAGTTRLQFQAGWPQELAGRKVDLYNVLLEPRKGSPNVLRFEGKEGTHVGTQHVEMELPGKSAYIWGIVAIEPATGKAWYRRFQLKGQ